MRRDWWQLTYLMMFLIGLEICWPNDNHLFASADCDICFCEPGSISCTDVSHHLFCKTCFSSMITNKLQENASEVYLSDAGHLSASCCFTDCNGICKDKAPDPDLLDKVQDHLAEHKKQCDKELSILIKQFEKVFIYVCPNCREPVAGITDACNAAKCDHCKSTFCNFCRLVGSNRDIHNHLMDVHGALYEYGDRPLLSRWQWYHQRQELEALCKKISISKLKELLQNDTLICLLKEAGFWPFSPGSDMATWLKELDYASLDHTKLTELLHREGVFQLHQARNPEGFELIRTYLAKNNLPPAIRGFDSAFENTQTATKTDSELLSDAREQALNKFQLAIVTEVKRELDDLDLEQMDAISEAIQAIKELWTQSEYQLKKCNCHTQSAVESTINKYMDPLELKYYELEPISTAFGQVLRWKLRKLDIAEHPSSQMYFVRTEVVAKAVKACLDLIKDQDLNRVAIPPANAKEREWQHNLVTRLGFKSKSEGFNHLRHVVVLRSTQI